MLQGLKLGPEPVLHGGSREDFHGAFEQRVQIAGIGSRVVRQRRRPACLLRLRGFPGRRRLGVRPGRRAALGRDAVRWPDRFVIGRRQQALDVRDCIRRQRHLSTRIHRGDRVLDGIEREPQYPGGGGVECGPARLTAGNHALQTVREGFNRPQVDGPGGSLEAVETPMQFHEIDHVRRHPAPSRSSSILRATSRWSLCSTWKAASSFC